MKETKKNSARLEYLKDLYEGAKSAAEDSFELFEQHEAQYLGSAEIDGSSEAACTVRNITYEIVESEVNTDIPTAKTDAASYSEQRERNARSIERLCNSVRDSLPFEAMNDLDERYTYIYGASVWYVEWDSEAVSASGVGGVKVHCISPENFIPEPGVCAVEDMAYCFLRFVTTRGELMRKYGVTKDEAELAECEYEYDTSSSDVVTLVVAFVRGEDGIEKAVFSGDLLLSDIPNYYARRTYLADGEDSEITHEVIPKGKLPAGAKEDAAVEYYTPKRFPIIIRKNTSGTPSLYGTSDCEIIRPQQQAINKVESRILKKLLRSGITPVMPEDSTVTLNNAIFGQVIKMKPGESVDSYGKIDTTPDISQDIEEAERLYEQARRIMGISDALQGNDTLKSESGYARQLRISQANGRLASKRQIKYHAYSELYRMIFEHYLAFADEPRTLSYKDGFGRIHAAQFNKYDFIELAENGEYAYYDEYLFSVDLNSGAEYTRELLWERNLANLEAGTLGDKESPVTLLRYWQSQERAHYPYARENVEYFKSLVEKAEIK